MVIDRDPAAARALARRSWPVRKYQLGAEPGDDLSAFTTAEERLSMMWPLALEAWELTGQLLPTYPRDETPVRFLRVQAPEAP
jgi:hypothetical protein